MKEKIKRFLFYDIEKWVLNNLTRISIYLMLLLAILQTFFYFINKPFLEIKDFITILGAIFVFWYGYKTYERNKELEIIEKYSNKYNSITKLLTKGRENIEEKFKNKLSQSDIQKELYELYDNYISLFNLFEEEFYLYEKMYINKDLWNIWKMRIEIDIKDLIEFEYNLNNDYKKIINFFYNICNSYTLVLSENNINYKFIIFLEETIKNYKQNLIDFSKTITNEMIILDLKNKDIFLQNILNEIKNFKTIKKNFDFLT